MCLFKSWLTQSLLVLLFYNIKKFHKVLLRSSWIKILHYHCIQSIPWDPNLETLFIFLCSFYYPIIARSFFPDITLLRLHVKI